MRVLVTGLEGQLSRSLKELSSSNSWAEIIRVGRPQFDLLKPETIAPAIAGARPDIVVSAAAYTAVEQAEDEPGQAFAVNATGAGLVAAAAARAGLPVIHLSTDFVFSGAKPGEHEETDATEPINVYGRSKLQGEIEVADANPKHVIVRTAWVYSPFGRNFVKTMLGLARERDAVRVVADQQGNPTAANDIASGILKIAARIAAEPEKAPYGLFHMAGEGATTWAGLARHIFSESGRLGGPTAMVEEITSAEFPTKAARPANSRLSCAKLLDAYGWRPPAWEASSSAVVARLVNGAAGDASSDVPSAR